MAWLFGQWSQSPHWVLLPCPSGAPGGDRAGDRVCLCGWLLERGTYMLKSRQNLLLSSIQSIRMGPFTQVLGDGLMSCTERKWQPSWRGSGGALVEKAGGLGKRCAWSSWGYAWTRHGEGEEGGMTAEGAGDSLAPAPCPGMESTSAVQTFCQRGRETEAEAG